MARVVEFGPIRVAGAIRVVQALLRHEVVTECVHPTLLIGHGGRDLIARSKFFWGSGNTKLS